MTQKGLSAEDIKKVHRTIVTNTAYEPAEQCVYVHIDDVGVKEQKQHRDKKGVAKEPNGNKDDAEKNKRPTVQNTVARIEHGGKGFTLTGRSVMEVLAFVLAFLLNNPLLKLNIKFCTDGQRSLQYAIIGFFSWHKLVSLLLDWFHVVKKLKEDLSLACRGREIRNRHLKQLTTFLWFGLVDKAQAYLAAIPKEDIKDSKAIERLMGYLERNRKWIPCYAMRSKLKLPNSSNPVERCNNLVTANRQKLLRLIVQVELFGYAFFREWPKAGKIMASVRKNHTSGFKAKVLITLLRWQRGCIDSAGAEHIKALH